MDLLAARIAAEQAAAARRAADLRARVPALVRALRARGATRVVLFGSLARGGTPHATTDVDLCVFELPSGLEADASWALSEELGSRVDVVRWESAGERVRARITRDGVDVTNEQDVDVAG